MMSKRFLSAVLMALAAGTCGVASAQSTWLMTGGCTQGGTNSGTFGNTYSCAQDAGAAANATLSAWSTGRNNSSGGSNTYSLTGSGWASAYVGNYTGGFGTSNREEADAAGSLAAVSAPNHAVDNVSPGNFDMIMVKFDTAQILSTIGVGWGGDDSDVTLMRWTGTSAPTTTNGTVTGGGSAANLTSNLSTGGWELVGSYSNLCNNLNNLCTNSSVTAGGSTISTGSTATGATLASSYWLIAAYNTTMDTTNVWTTGNDAFKLNYLVTTAYSCNGTLDVGGHCTPNGGGSAPEPGSLALLLAVGSGVFLARRRPLMRRDAMVGWSFGAARA